MSENQNRGARDFSIYDALETQELEAILRLDSEAPQGQESDTEKILYIMEVLTRRRKNENITGKTALEAWESFEKNYLPTDEEDTESTPEPKKTLRPWVRRWTAAAAVIVLLVGISATAVSAFGWKEIWNAVAKWAKETFSFVSSDAALTEPEESFAQEYRSLQEALAATGQKFDFVPTWIPDGYKLNDITVDENPVQSIYVAQYKNGEKDLVIAVQSYLETDLEIVEINDNLLEIYEVTGVKYHIFSNNKQLRAVWKTDSYECYISGELSVEEIKAMIDSIGKE